VELAKGCPWFWQIHRIIHHEVDLEVITRHSAPLMSRALAETSSDLSVHNGKTGALVGDSSERIRGSGSRVYGPMQATTSSSDRRRHIPPIIHTAKDILPTRPTIASLSGREPPRAPRADILWEQIVRNLLPNHKGHRNALRLPVVDLPHSTLGPPATPRHNDNCTSEHYQSTGKRKISITVTAPADRNQRCAASSSDSVTNAVRNDMGHLSTAVTRNGSTCSPDAGRAFRQARLYSQHKAKGPWRMQVM
jgi:hypothetical protein